MPYPIQTSCPRCRAAFVVQESQIGTQVTCPDCLDEFFVEPSKSASPPNSSTEHFPSAPLPSDDSTDSLDEFPHDGEEIKAEEQPGRAKPHEPSPEQTYDFSASCPLCGTRQDVTREQIGKSIKCPDCHLSFTVSEPHRSARRTHVELPTANDDELRLSQLEPPTLRTKVAQDWIGAAKADFAKGTLAPARTTTPQSVIQETLRKAAAEFDEAAEDEPEFPRHPFRSNLLKFLSSPTTIVRWFFTAVALEIELGAVDMTIRSALAGGLAQIFALFIGIFAGVFGLLLFCFISTSLLLVTQHSSQGRDKITGWPGINVTEWMFEAWPMVAALFLTFAPGVLLGQAIAAISNDTSWISWLGVAIGFVSMTLLFPVFLLSFMENSSPYSKPIWRSVRVSQPAWLSFWLHSGTLVLLLGLLVRWRLRSGSGFGGLMLDIGLLLGLLIYFRLLGRLSWACAEELARLEERKAGASAPQSEQGQQSRQ
jgi:predicted Zn finger-like uncharacterized protein